MAYRKYATSLQHATEYEQVVIPERRAAYTEQLQSYKDNRIDWEAVLHTQQEFFMARLDQINQFRDDRIQEVMIDGFSRFKPSRGNNPDSDYYLGKRMPGFRSVEAGPAAFLTPDLEKLPWKLVNGAKEFHLIPMAVQREFLPGHKMNVYG